MNFPAGHGNAGLASNFIDLADQKLKGGGVLALVLPLVAVAGESWAATRKLLARRYRDVTVLAIATTGQTDRAFSADTGMGEALIVAVKREQPVESGDADARALYVNLHRRPGSLAEGAETARVVRGLSANERGYAYIGDEEIGGYIGATLADGGCASQRNIELAGAAVALAKGVLRLPRLGDDIPVAITTLSNLGAKGMYDMQIGSRRGASERGPFEIVRAGDQPSYPALWAHAADRERRLVVEPDSEGRVRHGCDPDAVRVWETATRLHFNRDFQINSQSLAACLTPERSIGGRAWPNFRVAGDPRREEALALWANTTLGLMCWWWTGTRQQQGRSILTISALPSLPALDVRTLSDAQLGDAAAIFGAFADREFLPANEAYRDPTRQALDRAVLVDLLGLPEAVLEPLEALRRQWCAEPTVHGGKSTRPA